MFHTFRRIALIAFLSLSTGLIPIVSQAESRITPVAYVAPISVRNDFGGSVVQYAQTVNRIRRRGAVVEISGRCDSACTLYLALSPSQLCVHSGASFGFHRAFGSNRSMNEWGTQYLYKSYPRWIRYWIDINGGLTNKVKRMSFSQASRFISTCESRVFASR